LAAYRIVPLGSITKAHCDATAPCARRHYGSAARNMVSGRAWLPGVRPHHRKDPPKRTTFFFDSCLAKFSLTEQSKGGRGSRPGAGVDRERDPLSGRAAAFGRTLCRFPGCKAASKPASAVAEDH
jgi:hypothetical protein